MKWIIYINIIIKIYNHIHDSYEGSSKLFSKQCLPKQKDKQCFDLRFYQIQFRKIKSMVKNIYKNKKQKEELKCMKRIHSHENVN